MQQTVFVDRPLLEEKVRGEASVLIAVRKKSVVGQIPLGSSRLCLADQICRLETVFIFRQHVRD